MTTSKTDVLVTERKTTHGAFEDHARVTQKFKAVLFDELNRRIDRGQPGLTPMQYESLEMILHKIGRIVAGDAAFEDHWNDIAGYAHIANGTDNV